MISRFLVKILLRVLHEQENYLKFFYFLAKNGGKLLPQVFFNGKYKQIKAIKEV